MANGMHLALLKQGADIWNKWRIENPSAKPDLSRAKLATLDLSGVDLRYANLEGARLEDSQLMDADLSDTRLLNTNMRGARFDHTKLNRVSLRSARLERSSFNNANLSGADLRNAKFEDADLTHSNLSGAYLRGTKLRGTCFRSASFGETVFVNVDLSDAENLDESFHHRPSSVDHRTLALSRNVPVSFWRGCGLPDRLIDYLPSLLGDAIQFYSCFISYSSKDQEFAERLHADLQNAGVRCWFAPHDLPIGAKTWDGIDDAIRTRDKVLLILSNGAIGSDWVEDEVTTAFAEERRRKELMLFPVRLDDAVLETDEPWAGKLRDNRNIGDFSRWKDHDAYKLTLERVLRDLKADR